MNIRFPVPPSRQDPIELPQPRSSGESIKLPQPRSSGDIVADAYDVHPSEPITLKQPDRIPDPDAPTVTLYVRKGDHAKERTISINPIPDGVDPMALLRIGFAVDGNSAILSVDPYTFAYSADVEGGNVEMIHRWMPGGVLPGDWATAWSLTKAVSCIEQLLVNWLTRRLGCQVKFG